MTTNDTTSAKTRTITLTDRPPVTIREDAWPVIASAADKDFDGQYEFQANCVSRWNLNVRQHADQRTLVYGRYAYRTNYQNAREYDAKAGVLLAAPTGAELVAAIKDVAAMLASQEHHENDALRWTAVSVECIADLPAEAL